MTDQEQIQLLTEEVRRVVEQQLPSVVEQQLAPVAAEVRKVLKSLQARDDQKRHAEEQRRQRALWQLEELCRLLGMDPAALSDRLY